MPYLHQASPRHYCSPPDPFGKNSDWEPPEEFGQAPRLKPGVRLPQVGDIWECPTCHRQWRLQESPYVNVLTPNWIEIRRVRTWLSRLRKEIAG